MQNFQSDIFKNNLEIREAFIEVRSIEEKKHWAAELLLL